MVLLLGPILLHLLAVSNKVILQQHSGAFLTQTDPLHVWRHQLVLGGEVLGVEKLVDLHSPPLSILHPSTSPSSTLHKSSNLVVWTEEDDNVYLGKINAEQHFVA